jgi:hypothetical protein
MFISPMTGLYTEANIITTLLQMQIKVAVNVAQLLKNP